MKTYKILVVDDEINYIKSIVQSLIESKEPYILYQALNGKLAFKIATSELPDLIITDWEMPEMTGIELIVKLKQHELTSEIPVVMCTGVMTNSENLHTALMSGAVDFIRKPIDKIELIARVKSMLVISDSRKFLKERLVEIECKNKFINAIIESIPHPYVYYNLDGGIIGFNHQFKTLVGFTHQILGEQIIYDYLDDEKTGIHFEQDLMLKTNKMDISYEFKLQGRDFVFAKSLFLDSNVHSAGILCILTEISELKQVHNEILENKKRELTSSALRLAQISELNSSIISDLSKIDSFADKKGREMIR